MKAGERDRVGALRMLANALQQEAKAGGDDEVAVLQRERKKRLEAAEAFSKGGSEDRAAAERSEADLIEAYLPGPALRPGVGRAGGGRDRRGPGDQPGEMGKVMSLVMPLVAGRADGKRVSAAVRDRLAG